MKTFEFVLVSSLVLLGLVRLRLDASVTPGDEGKRSLGDEVQDDHGNLRWESWVTRADSSGWVYGRELRNRDTKLKCRVNWASAKWKTTLKAGETKKAGLDAPQEIPPNDFDGKIAYNGGPVPGEGEADAACIRPKEFKAQLHDKDLASKPITSWGELSIDIDDEELNINLFASSYFKELTNQSFEYTYFLAASPVESKLQSALIRWLPMEGRNGLRREFEEVIKASKSGISMTPIATKMIDLEGDHLSAFTFGGAPRVWSVVAVGDMIHKAGFPNRVSKEFDQFFKSKNLERAVVLINAVIKLPTRPEFRDDSIQLLLPSGGREVVLGEVLLPAWGSAK